MLNSVKLPNQGVRRRHHSDESFLSHGLRWRASDVRLTRTHFPHPCRIPVPNAARTWKPTKATTRLPSVEVWRLRPLRLEIMRLTVGGCAQVRMAREVFFFFLEASPRCCARSCAGRSNKYGSHGCAMMSSLHRIRFGMGQGLVSWKSSWRCRYVANASEPCGCQGIAKLSALRVVALLHARAGEARSVWGVIPMGGRQLRHRAETGC
ncbi:hypothetical protein B0J12DRAFT_124084 [Macrophomina phaseolina]|uniref:Uncharacterized protein n=1 Tax=Macrophomina phaseolina TaxID=35725 RepID=A0ABQ8GAE4_9PEZI|nr:hypothetical protein B0J12DRAFT_124084 [Macrophomina phaseolina]